MNTLRIHKMSHLKDELTLLLIYLNGWEQNIWWKKPAVRFSGHGGGILSIR